MGVQANIHISFYTEIFTEKKQIFHYLEKQYLYIQEPNEYVKPIGNRVWETKDLTEIFISVKNWEEKECQLFFKYLKEQIDWQFPKTLQIYYTPAKFNKDNYSLFEYIKPFD